MLELERHLLTIAGSGGGKFVNHIRHALRGDYAWTDSAVIVDPKGEAAEETAVWRRDTLGQKVAVLDPFRYANVPDELRATFNPLAQITTLEGINTVADGLVIREPGERDPHWPESARLLFKGGCAVVLDAPNLTAAQKNLVTVGHFLRQLQDKTPIEMPNPDDPGGKPKKSTPAEMALAELRACDAFGGIAQEAASMISDSTETSSFFKNFTRQRQWLISPDMQAFLSAPSTIDLHELKRGRMTIYLVLPPNMLDDYARFLRLFVALTQSVMWRKMPDGKQLGTRCLFILDEFAALGEFKKLVKEGLPQGRSFGLHVWPFVQYWQQLTDVYEESGAEAFTASADATIVYAVGNHRTATEVSSWADNVTERDVADDWLQKAAELQRHDELLRTPALGEKGGSLFNEKSWEKSQALGGVMRTHNKTLVPDHRKQAELEIIRAKVGRPRIAPDEVQRITAKEVNEPSRWAMLFRGGKHEVIGLIPYFDTKIDPDASPFPIIINNTVADNRQEQARLTKSAAIFIPLFVAVVVGFGWLRDVLNF